MWSKDETVDGVPVSISSCVSQRRPFFLRSPAAVLPFGGKVEASQEARGDVWLRVGAWKK